MQIPCALIIDSVSVTELRDDVSFWRMYDESFPADEKEPQSVIIKTLSEKKGTVLRARYRSGHNGDVKTVGLAVVHDIVSPRAHFVIYLAVARPTRKHGVGTRLLHEIQSTPLGVHHGSDSEVCTLLEVDNPEGTNDTQERERRTARIAFFEKAGFRIICRDYRQPPLDDGKKPVRMFLMIAGSPQVETREIVKAIYFEKYGTMNGIPRHVLDDLLECSFRGEQERTTAKKGTESDSNHIS